MGRSQYANIFSTFDLCGVTIPNRIIMPPMGTGLAGPGGDASLGLIAFYEARARGGIGMIVVEFICVDLVTGTYEHRQLSLEGERNLASH